MALEELRLRAKGANFSSVRPRASLYMGGSILSAAISDFSLWGVNDIQSFLIVCLHIAYKIHGYVCVTL